MFRFGIPLFLATWVVVHALPQPRMLVLDADNFVKESFDFLIVGGGTSGLIVAARLAENPNIQVGVIEAGEYLPDDANINVPQGTNYLGNPKYDWMLSSTPQKGANNRSIFLARGKIVGGSSAINALVWQRGAREDYDSWSSVVGNDPSWSFNGLLPYFKKVENWSPPTLMFPGQVVTSEFKSDHGKGGPIQISYANYMTDIDVPCHTTAVELGLGFNLNPDGGNMTGFPLLARNVDPRNGQRSYTAPGYFAPDLHRNNLKLLTGAQVIKINFNSAAQGSKKKNFATGVDFLLGGKTYSVRAQKELILAAGSLKTPQLLEISGVGNPKLLNSLGIKSILNLPQVGENLQDHPLCVTDFKIRDGFETLDQLRFNSTFMNQAEAQYKSTHAGPLTYTPSIYGMAPLQKIVSSSRMRSLLAQLDKEIFNNSPNLSPLQKVQYTFQRKLLSDGKVGTVGFTVVPVGGIASPASGNASYVSVVAVSMHPFGRGSTHITNLNATASPAIDVGYLSSDFDTQLLVEGLKFNRKWTETAPFSRVVEGPHTPPSNVTSDEDVTEYLRNNLLPHNHPLGTTAMAPQKLGGVVDSRLKIYGLENVRIVDAGVIPMMVTSTIAPTVCAIAEKAADIIKKDWHI
ncbi:hypothetical protein BDZ94DRAFT_1195503 [Collybia nuda]|uniref:Glucose-methanol-choline oxidoreductase N-terminal domain-containing protein n=1 Tax=Collybia nuda TaxID=64659 RepID=A0A9P6CIJ8_9AGAR|nr:hypothetical protein BDZ94DRAFT_1195503 [Collybia nuda]